MGVFTKETPPGPAKPARYGAIRSLTAAASVVQANNKTELDAFRDRKKTSAWQEDAWDYYDLIGEIKYGFGMFSNIVSRVRLNAAVSQGDSEVPRALDKNSDVSAEAREAADKCIADLFGSGKHSELLRIATLCLLVSGECWLVKIPSGYAGSLRPRWKIVSNSELIELQDKKAWGLKTRANQQTNSVLPLPSSTFMGRIWKQHPRFSDESDSSMRSLVDLCGELLLLSRTVRATARSRLNAGALLVPESLSVSADVAGDFMPELIDDDGLAPLIEDESDTFEEELIEAMTTPISDEDSAAAVVPLLIRGMKEELDAVRLIKFERAFDPQLTSRADRALERILQGVDLPKEMVTGLANIKYCADETTEILTREGWKTYDKLTVGEEVLTLNHTTGLSEWQQTEAVNTFDVTDEPMLHLDQRGHSSLTTLEHSWPVSHRAKNGTRTNRWSTSGTLKSTESLINSAQAADLPVESKYSDDLVELAAWLYTEGHIRPAKSDNGRRFGSIAQSYKANPQHFDRIHALMTRLYGPETPVMNASQAAIQGALSRKNGSVPSWHVRTSHLGYKSEFFFNEEIIRSFESVFTNSKNKIIDRAFIYNLTRAQLELFIQVSSWGDGCGKTIVGSVFGQNNEARQEVFELACHLAGYPIARRSNGGGWFDCVVKKRTTVWPHRQHHNVEKYTGTVWCPTTANHTWFARRNGTHYFTGNSNSVVIRDSFYTAHIEPLIMMLCDAFRVIYLEPHLKAAGIAQDEIDKLVVWYDPSAITTVPDKSNAANVGYDRYALSAKAWRRENGFDDDDAPDKKELALRLALARGQISQEVNEQLLKEIIPEALQATREQSLADSPVKAPDSVQQLLDGRQAPPPDTPEAAPKDAVSGPRTSAPPPASNSSTVLPPGAVPEGQ